MKIGYNCGGIIFDTLADAVEYSNYYYFNNSVVLGIEKVEYEG